MAKKSTRTLKQPSNTPKKIPGQNPKLDTHPTAVPIIGIGASAGGLEALEGLFAHMPPDIDAAFVVIQHLDPHHKSMMGELLQSYASLKVIQITDGLAPEKNCIYTNPPNYMVGLLNRAFVLSAVQKPRTSGLPIDYFFRTLADDLQEQAIAIVLSGTGTDGSLGIKSIKGQGGMTIVQDEDQAAYSGMPGSAINTGLVDLVLPVQKIGPELRSYMHHPYIREEKRTTADDAFNQYLNKILLLIRSNTGNDFSGYKQNTIRRRIERRMALHQFGKIEDYHRFCQQNPAETDILFKDMLIGVTNFFRDPEAFETLSEKSLPAIIQHKNAQTPVRIWVPGCSTGEEAYSLAILLVEAMEKQELHFDVQIFATDIDDNAIAFARQGAFPDNIAADISKQRLRRFFIKNGNAYTIAKPIRDMIVFAHQNLIKDPPFSKLDLISCRNLLIYMDSVLQKQILPLFHFTLVPDGILFLGSSESIGGFVDLFTPIDTKHKLFRRKEVLLEDMSEYPVPPLVQPNGAFQSADIKSRPKLLNSRSIAEKMIMDHYAPASVLVNDHYNILYFIGDTSRYLIPPVGEPVVNLKQMVRKELRYKLSLALNESSKRKKQITTETIAFQTNGTMETLKITVNPFSEPTMPPGLMMVIFESQAPPAAIEGNPGQNVQKIDAVDRVDPEVVNLEQELKYTRENLQTTIEELETSNEELKSTNEELQSTNEELQSTNEELETSKEEMHSTNEELVTINAELQNKVKELEGVNNDIHNLLSSTEIATVFLDCELRIKRFTPTADRMFNLIAGDIGRPIGDITSKMDYDALQTDAKQVLDKLIPIEKELQIENGRWVSMKMLPYRTSENVIDGIVITIIDITNIKQANKVRLLATVVQDANDAITVQDFSGRIMAWNHGAEKIYGWSEYEALKMNIQKIIPEDKRDELSVVLKKLMRGQRVGTFETERISKDNRILCVALTVTALTDESGRPVQFASTERIVTPCDEGGRI